MYGINKLFKAILVLFWIQETSSMKIYSRLMFKVWNNPQIVRCLHLVSCLVIFVLNWKPKVLTHSRPQTRFSEEKLLLHFSPPSLSCHLLRDVNGWAERDSPLSTMTRRKTCISNYAEGEKASLVVVFEQRCTSGFANQTQKNVYVCVSTQVKVVLTKSDLKSQKQRCSTGSRTTTNRNMN